MSRHDSGGGQGDVQPPTDAGDLNKDPAALGEAMEACRRYLLLVANKEMASVLRPKGGASDLVQETFLEAHRDMKQFSGTSTSELKGWLRRILRNNLSNFIRRYRSVGMREIGREVSLDRESPSGNHWDNLSAPTLSPGREAILREEAARLEHALGRLPERDRLVVVWRSHDHCRWDEIGRRLGGSPEMARKIWTRAVERLRVEVGDASASSQHGFAHV